MIRNFWDVSRDAPPTCEPQVKDFVYHFDCVCCRKGMRWLPRHRQRRLAKKSLAATKQGGASRRTPVQGDVNSLRHGDGGDEKGKGKGGEVDPTWIEHNLGPLPASENHVFDDLGLTESDKIFILHSNTHKEKRITSLLTAAPGQWRDLVTGFYCFPSETHWSRLQFSRRHTTWSAAFIWSNFCLWRLPEQVEEFLFTHFLKPRSSLSQQSSKC